MYGSQQDTVGSCKHKQRPMHVRRHTERMQSIAAHSGIAIHLYDVSEASEYW